MALMSYISRAREHLLMVAILLQSIEQPHNVFAKAPYASTSSSRAGRRPSLSGTFAPAHTVQHKPMAVGAALALMS